MAIILSLSSYRDLFLYDMVVYACLIYSGTNCTFYRDIDNLRQWSRETNSVYGRTI